MDEREKYIEAGKISAQALKYGTSLIKIGASLLEVTEKVEEKILDLGGEFTFPPQISLNEVAAHYCADPDDTILFKNGDLVKLDCGAMVDGYPGDNAATVNLGSPENDSLVKASRAALDNALDAIRPGIEIGEIGRIIQDTIMDLGYSPVKNLSGHGLSRYEFHTSPNIPNFDTGDTTKLKEGMVIAIEPFASNGSGMIYESGSANIFSVVNRKPVRNIVTRNVMKEVEKYHGMPFTTRWLTKKFPEFKVKFALRDMIQQGIIRGYPPLPDTKKGFISQAEHSVIVEDDPIVTTRI